MTRAAFLVLVAAPVLGLIACPGVPRPLERPSVTVLDAVAADAGDPAALLVRVGFSVHNPNPDPLVARALDWQLGTSVGTRLRGRTPLEATIPGKRTTRLEATLRVPAEAAHPMLTDLRSGERGYRLTGTIHLFGARGDLGVPFDQRGRLRAPRP